MRELEKHIKDWLSHLPPFEEKIQALGDLMDYQIMIGKSMTPEQKEKFKKLVEEAKCPPSLL